MIAMTLGEIAAAVHGRLVLPSATQDAGVQDAAAPDAAAPGQPAPDPAPGPAPVPPGQPAAAHATADTVILGVSDTDSRNITPGDVFFAKPGDTTDGHLFIPNAVAAGAALVVAERETRAAVPQIIVENTVAALGNLATEVVARARAQGRLRIVGITGSNGKTTTKNFVRDILRRALGPEHVVAPIASFNNEVGAPVTFLKVSTETDVLVAEMGASHIGEVAALARMAPPDVGVVLMVGLAHAGEFGGIDATATAKSELVQALRPGGIAVLNADDPRVVRMAALAPGDILWFGRSESAAVRASDIRVGTDGTRFILHLPGEPDRPLHLPILGEHHIMNALAAAAATHALGVPGEQIVTALREDVRPERGRMQPLATGEITVINDAYNANPNSMAAALRTLAEISGEGRSIAVLGAMAELGDISVAEHNRLGELAVRLGIDRVVVVGRQARPLYLAAVAQGSWDNEAVFAETVDEAFTLITADLRSGDTILVKSSLTAGLQPLAERLGDYAKEHAA